jgi:hypothetical protein
MLQLVANRLQQKITQALDALNENEFQFHFDCSKAPEPDATQLQEDRLSPTQLNQIPGGFS